LVAEAKALLARQFEVARTVVPTPAADVEAVEWIPVSRIFLSAEEFSR